ncbi:PfkB family carbohydrate kinase [Streptomyces sp. NPDC048441]|uniref:PfkB family carbohydrate kinase n=1 Tax=Streptomyces sp. NPDC048441 TaxID=3365552 RepID=UPI0037182EF2
MPIAVTGVIAMDHLMAFPGRFPERPVAGRPHVASLAFLAERITTRRGGAAADIAFGLGRIGLAPVLVGAVGGDFADYQVWLKQHGVDIESVLVVPGERTAQYVCTTDAELNRITSYHPGASRAAYTISLRSVAARTGGLDLVMISANDPAAMHRHTEECRALGVPFAADPARQLAGMARKDVKCLIGGASWLFTDEYESTMIKESTGWTTAHVLDQVRTWVTTLGAAGVRIERAGHEPCLVPAVESVTESVAQSVTGSVGARHALRAGLLAGIARGAPPEGAAQLGCALASFALESAGPQEYPMDVRALLTRIRVAYGHRAAAAVRPVLADAS